MTIEQSQTVDFVNIDHTSGDVVLVISDHLSWEKAERDHLVLLQDKLNTYLKFIESGELTRRFPDAIGRNVVINLVGQFSLSQTARIFFAKASDAITNAGFKLRFEMFRPVAKVRLHWLVSARQNHSPRGQHFSTPARFDDHSTRWPHDDAWSLVLDVTGVPDTNGQQMGIARFRSPRVAVLAAA